MSPILGLAARKTRRFGSMLPALALSSSRKMRILLNERFSARADRLSSGSDCRTRESASFALARADTSFHGSPRPWNGVSALSKLRESSQEVFGRTGDHKKNLGQGRAVLAFLGRAPAPSLETGAHPIDVHVVNEYCRDHHDGLILEVTA
jgi:hypothetical protein